MSQLPELLPPVFPLPERGPESLPRVPGSLPWGPGSLPQGPGLPLPERGPESLQQVPGLLSPELPIPWLPPPHPLQAPVPAHLRMPSLFLIRLQFLLRLPEPLPCAASRYCFLSQLISFSSQNLPMSLYCFLILSEPVSS